jgi:hypothetical protein
MPRPLDKPRLTLALEARDDGFQHGASRSPEASEVGLARAPELHANQHSPFGPADRHDDPRTTRRAIHGEKIVLDRSALAAAAMQIALALEADLVERPLAREATPCLDAQRVGQGCKRRVQALLHGRPALGDTRRLKGGESFGGKVHDRI